MRRIFSAAFFILDYRAARWCCGYFLTANTRTTPPCDTLFCGTGLGLAI
jgi:hypothetical protein